MALAADPGRPVRIANCSGFYGDRIAAAREQVGGGPIDVLTGDWLAELTMGILAKDRARDESAGYARTFLRQAEDVLATCVERGIRVVVNAGGLNPHGCAQAVEALAARLGVTCTVGVVDGDDLRPHWAELFPGEAVPATANAYLGGFGVAEALRRGADVVVTGRVADASLVSGAAAWWFGWGSQDLDALAGAVAAGHVIECGAQATGGNVSWFRRLEAAGVDLTRPGFPIAEVAADGSAVITKHPGTGGALTVDTVTAQLLYEVTGPRYANPDVVVRLDTVTLTPAGADRVRLSGTRGEPAPATAKVAVTAPGGFRTTMTFVLTGRHLDAKADLVRRALAPFEPLHVERIGAPPADDPTRWGEAMQLLRVSAMGADPAAVGRRFSAAVVELALANYPGLFLTSPPGDATAFMRYEARSVPAEAVRHGVHVGGTHVEVPTPSTTPLALDTPVPGDAAVLPGGGPTRRVPLGVVAGARSGDKGADANVGVWVAPAAWPWLRTTLTTAWFRTHLPECDGRVVDRYELANLGALNVVIRGLLAGPLGDGAAANPGLDAQAKSLGEYLLAKAVEVPVTVLDDLGVG
jgi:hypothetical protein